MTEVEDVQLQSLERLKIVDESDSRMAERFGEVATADGPERIGLGDRAHRLDRLGNDSINQRISEDDGFGEPCAKGIGLPGLRGKALDDAGQAAPILRH